MHNFETNQKETQSESALNGWGQLEAVSNSNINNYSRNDTEILQSDVAQNTLPYLTLKHLTDHEQAEVIQLWEKAIDTTNRKDSLLSRQEELAYSISEMFRGDKTGSNSHIEANKLLDALAINHLNTSKMDSKIKEAFTFLFLEWSGRYQRNYMNKFGLSGCLELLSIAERSEYTFPKDILHRHILEIEENSPNSNAFIKVLKESDAIQQLKILPVLPRVSEMHELHQQTQVQSVPRFEDTLKKILPTGLSPNEFHEYTDFINKIYESIEHSHETFTDKIATAIDWLKKDSDTTPLIKLIAENLSNEEWKKDTQYKTVKYYDKSANIDYDMSYLLNTTHRPVIKKLVEEKLNMKLDDISPESQIQLLKFMTTSDNGRFDKLCNTLNNLNPDIRLKLAESFLSADFGEDFGDSLLEIANSKILSSEQIGNILDNIDSSRKSIKEITSLFQHFNDKNFQNEYSRAANERLTDAITVFKEIAKTGKAEADLGWAGKTNFTYGTALEALNYETNSLKIISSTMRDVINGKDGSFAEKILRPSEQRERSMYNFYSPDSGYVLLYTRPEGSCTFDQAIEYGKANVGVEASISFIVNPVNPMELPSPFRPDFQTTKNPNFYDPITMDKVSALRLDREGRAPNTPANDPDRSPINPIGTISVDLAAINDRADTPSGKIARLFSVGNKLRMGDNYSLNHNTNWFNQEKYGTSDGFKNLVAYLDSLAGIWCAQRPPKSSGQSFTSTTKATKSATRRAA